MVPSEAKWKIGLADHAAKRFEERKNASADLMNLVYGSSDDGDSSSGGDHSVFAEAFISILSDNEGVLDAAGLFSQLRPKVINNSDQTPEYSTIHQGGHDGGDFLFVRQ